MAAITNSMVSVEQYLARTEKPNCEYEDGVLHPKPMPTFSHSEIQYRATALLRKQGALAFPELTVRLSPTKFLVPDVAVVRQVEGQYLTAPALLCIEILSPEDGVGAMLAKCEKYHAWGVPFCWVIDPRKQTAWDYPAGGEPVHLDPAGLLEAGDLAVSLAELFADMRQL